MSQTRLQVLEVAIRTAAVSLGVDVPLGEMTIFQLDKALDSVRQLIRCPSCNGAGRFKADWGSEGSGWYTKCNRCQGSSTNKWFLEEHIPHPQMVDMLDCSTCRRIFELGQEKVALTEEMMLQIEKSRTQIEGANEALIREYGLRCRKYGIFSFFLRKPNLKELPDYTKEDWFKSAVARKGQIDEELNRLKVHVHAST